MIDEDSQKRISTDVILGRDVKISAFVNLYGCTIGNETTIGPFVEVQKNAVIGKRCKIQSHSFICEGVTIGNGCFIGHGVMFINDNYPASANKQGQLEDEDDWAHRFVNTHIGDNVTIGSNATVIGGINLGKGALIGAGSVVTKDVPENEIWAGNPAKLLRKLEK